MPVEGPGFAGNVVGGPADGHLGRQIIGHVTVDDNNVKFTVIAAENRCIYRHVCRICGVGPHIHVAVGRFGAVIIAVKLESGSCQVRRVS